MWSGSPCYEKKSKNGSGRGQMKMWCLDEITCRVTSGGGKEMQIEKVCFMGYCARRLALSI